MTINEIFKQIENIIHFFFSKINMPKKQKSQKNMDRTYRPYDKKDIYKRKKNSEEKMNSFLWSVSEEILYLEFLGNNKSFFISIQERKRNKVFVQMSGIIKTRDSQQCRSHHQKMSIKYGSIEEIISKIATQKIKLKLVINQDCENQISIQNFQLTTNKKIEDEQKSMNNFGEKEFSEIVNTPNDFTIEEIKLWDYLATQSWLNF